MSSSRLLPTSLRDDFPLLARKGPTDRALIYLDSAATSLKPRPVIAAVNDVLSRHSANVHRVAHVLGDEATELFEEARHKAAELIGAETHEVVFVRNATDGLNLVARCYPRRGRVLVSRGAHHSALLPWGRYKVERLAPKADGGFNEEALQQELIRGDVAIVVAAHVTNVTGQCLNVRRLADLAHGAGAILVVDGAQAVTHRPINVRELDCDFLAFSSHKMCGPSGLGVLYGKAERLAELEDHWQGGGTVEMIRQGNVVLRQLPWRLEAGTPAIESAIGFGAAVDYLRTIGLERIAAHNAALRDYALDRVLKLSGVRILGPCQPGQGHGGPLSFTLAGIPAHALARDLSDAHGICVRSGFHCAQLLHEELHSPPSLRLSFYLYNQPWEIDCFLQAVEEFVKVGRAAI
jgi:cysteine desulfurase / selenocysteine lyase